MTNRPDSYMPFYVGDYLRDTLRLTREQHGGYLLLIMAYWGDGAPLPDDDDQLAAITKAGLADWKKLRPALAPFFDIGGGLWRHKRIDEEMAKATAAYERRKAAGEKGNASAKRTAMRAHSDTQSARNAPRYAHRKARAMRPQEEPALRPQPEPEPDPHNLAPKEPNYVVSRAAARAATAAPPAKPQPGWEQSYEKWRSFAEKIGPDAWKLWFADCRPNGSETSLLAPSQFERDQIEGKFERLFEAHFGAAVSVKFEPKKWNPKGLAA